MYFRFLFGTCCLLTGDIETSLASFSSNGIKDNLYESKIEESSNEGSQTEGSQNINHSHLTETSTSISTLGPSKVTNDLYDTNENLSDNWLTTPESILTRTSESSVIKNKVKPIFKLKPTSNPSPTEKYVLVHTISNDKLEEADNFDFTKKPSTNESIQSIILMLNGTNPNSVYSGDNEVNSYISYTPSYGSTSMINRDKYGSSSYYITTKLPMTSSARPTSPVKINTTKNSNRIVATSSPQTPTTLNVPSTSYLYSPNPIKKRPTAFETTSSSPSFTATKKRTPIKPIATIEKETDLDGESFVVISGGGITKHPSPTVHITPKPIVNVLTTTKIHNANNKLTKNPSIDYKPSQSVYVSTTPGTFVTSSIFVPAIQDFHNEGYFAVTHRPGIVSSTTAVYTVNSDVLHSYPVTSNVAKKPLKPENLNFTSNAPDDLNNFP